MILFEPRKEVDEIGLLKDEDLAGLLESEVLGVTESKAEGLTGEYRNLYTVCWATIYDKSFMQEEFLIDPDFLRDQLQEEDLYVSYFGNRLYIPDRVPDSQVDIPLESYGGRYDFHQGNMDEWYKVE